MNCTRLVRQNQIKPLIAADCAINFLMYLKLHIRNYCIILFHFLFSFYSVKGSPNLKYESFPPAAESHRRLFV